MEIPKFDEIFEQINKNLRLSGIPLDNSKFGFKFFFLNFCLVLMIIEEGSFFVSKISPENLLELTALAPCLGIGALSFVKILSIATKRRNISELMEHLEQLYLDILSDGEKRELVSGEIVLVKSLTMYYFILNAVLICVFNFSTLFFMFYDYVSKGTVILGLPYSVLLPFSTNSLSTWLPVYIHSILCGFICVLYYTTVDALYCNLASQVCSNFTILSNEIKQLNALKVNILSDIVKRHQYILKLSEDLENIFSASNLYNVLVGSIEICALGFNIMTGDWSLIPGFILFLLSELLQIWVMSFFGESLIRESKRVGEAAFMCEWQDMDQKSKKFILIILIRAQKPQTLTAYRFSVICYESFTKIISTSWSYFTILRTVYKASDVAHGK